MKDIKYSFRKEWCNCKNCYFLHNSAPPKQYRLEFFILICFPSINHKATKINKYTMERLGICILRNYVTQPKCTWLLNHCNNNLSNSKMAKELKKYVDILVTHITDCSQICKKNTPEFREISLRLATLS